MTVKVAPHFTLRVASRVVVGVRGFALISPFYGPPLHIEAAAGLGVFD